MTTFLHTETILLDGSPHLIWTIKRPERRNAIGVNLAQELYNSLQSLRLRFKQSSERPRSLTLTATPTKPVAGGQPIWIAGGDLKELAAASTKEAMLYIDTMTDFCKGLSELPIPVIAVVDGLAIGGGAELALAADLRLATQDSALIFKQQQIGLATGYGGCKRLVDLIGLARAQKILLLGATITAEEALHLGLFHDLAPSASKLTEHVKTMQEAIAALPANSQAVQKRMLDVAVHLPPYEAQQAETDEFKKCWGNPYHRKMLDQFNHR